MSGWDRILELYQNPIFVKHWRSRLRPQSVIPAAIVVLVICLCCAVGGYLEGDLASSSLFQVYLGIQFVLLGIMGGSQISSAVGQASSSGILDFHRISPLTPGELTLGFFFGAPIREYLLFAVTLPFSILCVMVGNLGFRGLVQAMILLVLCSWLVHGMAMLNGLLFQRARGTLLLAGVVFLLMNLGTLFAGVGRLSSAEDARLRFFGISLPWIAVVILCALPCLAFLLLACSRRMISARTHPLSKRQATAAISTLGLLLLGTLSEVREAMGISIFILYVLVIAGAVLSVTVTPSQAEYMKGLRRQSKGEVVSSWHDLAVNRVFVAVVCSIVLVVATLAWTFLDSRSEMSGPRSGIPLAIANGVLVVASIGLGSQYFQLQFGKRGWSYFGLFLFFTWVLPLLMGSVALVSASGSWVVAQVLYALSPIVGIALSMGMVSASDPLPVQAAAITPSLAYTFVFNSLVKAAQVRLRAKALAPMQVGDGGRSEPGDPVRVELRERVIGPAEGASPGE